MLHELFNTETEHIEGVQDLPCPEAHSRNVALREKGEPQRWIIAGDHDREMP